MAMLVVQAAFSGRNLHAMSVAPMKGVKILKRDLRADLNGVCFCHTSTLNKECKGGVMRVVCRECNLVWVTVALINPMSGEVKA